MDNLRACGAGKGEIKLNTERIAMNRQLCVFGISHLVVKVNFDDSGVDHGNAGAAPLRAIDKDDLCTLAQYNAIVL